MTRSGPSGPMPSLRTLQRAAGAGGDGSSLGAEGDQPLYSPAAAHSGPEFARRLQSRSRLPPALGGAGEASTVAARSLVSRLRNAAEPAPRYRNNASTDMQ